MAAIIGTLKYIRFGSVFAIVALLTISFQEEVMDWMLDGYFWLKLAVPTLLMIIIIGEIEKRRDKLPGVDYLYRCQYCGEHRGVEIKKVLSERVINLLSGFPAQQMILESAVIVCHHCPCPPHRSARFAYRPAV